ncbi:hypothetical protein BV336_04757 [Pseudomonas syringae pv. actinidiae]|nr:hypothetical protein BV336_04757 [Pseudomonas syringae pv. actinidiae]
MGKLFRKQHTRLHANTLLRYYERVMPSLLNRRRILRYRPDQVLYIDLICDELGRLGTTLLLLRSLNVDTATLRAMHGCLVSFINVHNGCLLPVYDGQAIDLSIAMAAIMAVGDTASTQLIVRECIDRFDAALHGDRIMPVDTDDLEDAMALLSGKETQIGRFFKTTTLVPLLGTMAALLGDQEALDQLTAEIIPNLGGVTKERWFPQKALQTLTGSDAYVNAIGISRSLTGFRQTPVDEVEASVKVPSQAASPEDFAWHNTAWEVLIAISARLHRHPLPTWYVAKLVKVPPAL